jgi:hypothetical protein
MALVCIVVLAGWTPVVLGDLGIPGAPVEDLKQKTAPVPVTKVGPAATGAWGGCAQCMPTGWRVYAPDKHTPLLRSLHAAVWAPSEGCGSVPLCRRVEFAPRRAVPKEAGLYQGQKRFKAPAHRARTRVHAHTGACSRARIFGNVHRRTRARTQAPACTCARAHACINTRTHTRARAHNHARTHARTHTVACTHTHVSKNTRKIGRTPTTATIPAPHTRMLTRKRLNPYSALLRTMANKHARVCAGRGGAGQGVG